MKKSLFELACVAIPKISGGLFTVGLNIVLVRFMGPESFGIYSLCIFGILLADGIVGSAIDLGVLKLSPAYRNKQLVDYALTIEKAAFLLKLAFFALIFSILLFAASSLSQLLFHKDQTADLLWISSLAAMGMILLRSFQVHLQVQGKFILYGTLDMLLNILRYGGVAIILCFFSTTPLSLLYMFAAAPLFLVFFSLFLFGKPFFPKFPRQKDAVIELLDLTKWFLLTFSLGAIISRLDIYLLTSLTSVKNVGIYSGGMIYAMIPELLGSYMALVIGPKVMIHIQQGTFFGLFRKVQLYIMGLAIVIFIVAFIALKFLPSMFLPESYTGSIQVLLTLLPGALANMCILPVMLTFLMFVKPRFWFTMESITLPLVVGGYFYFINEYGVLGAAAVASFQRISKALIGQYISWNLARKMAVH